MDSHNVYAAQSHVWHTLAIVTPGNDKQTEPGASKPDAAEELDDTGSAQQSPRPREIGGRGGLDPTRYGDWEKAGRCIDF
ncbi:MAG: DUF1674 domain-containing protein [Gammaproteobacteria bacterium]|nr:DUF1674 domain-containing protein [Gammaproteobacteria bacterium]